jgi:hypothetical protein
VSSLGSSFRTWWQPPRRTREREAQRQVTFLELFYDLVYVVLIAEVAHALSGHFNCRDALTSTPQNRPARSALPLPLSMANGSGG